MRRDRSAGGNAFEQIGRSHRVWRGRRWQPDTEGRATPWRRVHGNSATHGDYELPNDRQSQSVPARGAITRRVNAMEPLPYEVEMLRRNTAPCVADENADSVSHFDAHANCPTGGRVSDGV